MNDVLARAYDRSPYPDYAFWRTHPDFLGMNGRLYGLAPASPDRCKVLEIGCAVGGNIIPMAASAPGSQFVGVDISGVQVARARNAASASRIGNILFFHGDFRVVPAHLGPFDYIICHGVFAWVTVETQSALLAFIRERLAPHGVAFVSYNTYPGHHMVDMVRKLMQVHAGQAPDTQTRNEQALAIVRFVRRHGLRLDGGWVDTFLGKELEFLDRVGPDLLEHDYFAVENHPVYFVDFVDRCHAAGLGYLADSQPSDMFLDNLDRDVVETLKPLDDLVLQGQYLDFLKHTRFRETLLCRREAPVTRSVPSARIADFYIGHAFVGEPPLDGLKEGDSVEITPTHAPPIVVSNPAIRLALHRLWRHGRHLPTFETLVEEVAADLAEHGFSEGRAPDFRGRLAGQLIRCYFANVVRFSLRCPPVAPAMPERPATGRYQRHMAENGRPFVINLAHEVIDVTPEMRAVLASLDGTRTPSELEAALSAPVRELLEQLLRMGFVLAPEAAAAMA
jgi:SAM-dependent methyltransferase